MIRVTVSRRAIWDLKRPEAWLLARGAARSARKLSVLLLAGVESLVHFPERGRPVAGGERQIFVDHGRSRYVINHAVLGDDVVVTGVRSGREQPMRPLPSSEEPR